MGIFKRKNKNDLPPLSPEQLTSSGSTLGEKVTGTLVENPARPETANEKEAVRELAAQTEMLARARQLLGLLPQGERSEDEANKVSEPQSVVARLEDGSAVRVAWDAPSATSQVRVISIEKTDSTLELLGRVLSSSGDERTRLRERFHEERAIPGKGVGEEFFLTPEAGGYQTRRVTYESTPKRIVYANNIDRDQYRRAEAVSASEPLTILRAAWSELSEAAGIPEEYAGPTADELETKPVAELREVYKDMSSFQKIAYF